MATQRLGSILSQLTPAKAGVAAVYECELHLRTIINTVQHSAEPG